MPKILTKDNFSAQDLKNLYKKIVIEPNNNHSANNNDADTIVFFENTVKNYFYPALSVYNGLSYVDKACTVIKEIRGEILNKILISLDDVSGICQLATVNNFVKANLRSFIRTNKNILQELQFNCTLCAEFRKLINEILGPIETTNINSFNADPLLGAWRALDPENNRRSGYGGYINNIFSYNNSGELIVCSADIENSFYGKKIIEAIAVYYLATKISCSGLMTAMQERENRFIIFVATLTECLRGYNSGNLQGMDWPSCPGGIMGRLVEQCGYEQKIQFISKKTFVNNFIKDIICKKVYECLANITTVESVNNLLKIFITGCETEQELRKLELDINLQQQRYSFFDNINNNAVFFELIKEEVKKAKNAQANPIVINFYREISRYDYAAFVNDFLTLEEQQQNNNFRPVQEINRELKLIGYAFSDPAYSCYQNIVSMCLAKIKQLQSEFQQKVISEDLAMQISLELIDAILPTIAPCFLFADNFKSVDMAIIIGSYKSGLNSRENNRDFINRIIKKFYYDIDEFGEPEPNDGLDSIINKLLIHRSDFINKIAMLILKKIKQKLTPQQQANLELDLELNLIDNIELPVNDFLTGYNPGMEEILGQIVSQNLQHIFVNIGQYENRSRYILGVRNTRSAGPYSNILDLPNVPVVHPYFPNGASNNQLYDAGIPSFPIVVKIPQGTLGNLPSGVKEQLKKYNININKLEVFFCMQNMPWQTGEELLLRPHPWLYQDAPFRGNYVGNESVLAGIMAVNANLDSMVEVNVSAHNVGGRNRNVVYSPDNMKILGLNNFNQTHSFYSCCISRKTKKAALTLHWLLNRQDYWDIMHLMSNAHNHNARFSLQEIINWANTLINSRLHVPVDGVGAGQDIPISALDALQFLIIGGQPNILLNNSKYRLMEQPQLEGEPFRREIIFREQASTELSSSSQEEPVVPPSPQDDIVPIEVRYASYCRRLG